MKPREATTTAKKLKLSNDHKDLKSGWLLLNGCDTVILCNQRVGEQPTGKVTFSHREFRALVDWYNRDQKPPRRE